MVVCAIYSVCAWFCVRNVTAFARMLVHDKYFYMYLRRQCCVIDACPGKETQEYTHIYANFLLDSMMYGFYLANAKSFSQMIASVPAVLRVRRVRMVGSTV